MSIKLESDEIVRLIIAYGVGKYITIIRIYFRDNMF